MSYAAQAQLARDPDFIARVAAAAATQDLDADSLRWAQEHSWEVAAAPGFADDYNYALVTLAQARAAVEAAERPGHRTDVIDDAAVLAAVQAVAAEEEVSP